MAMVNRMNNSLPNTEHRREFSQCYVSTQLANLANLIVVELAALVRAADIRSDSLCYMFRSLLATAVCYGRRNRGEWMNLFPFACFRHSADVLARLRFTFQTGRYFRIAFRRMRAAFPGERHLAAGFWAWPPAGSAIASVSGVGERRALLAIVGNPFAFAVGPSVTIARFNHLDLWANAEREQFHNPVRLMASRGLGCRQVSGDSLLNIKGPADVANRLRARINQQVDKPRSRHAIIISGGYEQEQRPGYAGEHQMPGDWRVLEWKAVGGYGLIGEDESEGTGRANSRKERLQFSPHCLQPRQRGLFE